MNFGSKKKVYDQSSGITFKKELKNAQSPLLIYNQAPDGKLDFDEFATLALERFAGEFLLLLFVLLFNYHSKSKWT